MTKTVKAAFVTKLPKSLTISELSVPESKDWQVLVKIEAWGVCHPNVHASDSTI